MAAIYSTSFIKSHGGAGGEYTVPEGFVAVVRCITAINTQVLAPEGYSVFLGHSSCTIANDTLDPAFSGSPGWGVVHDLRVVVEATDTIHVNNDPDVDVTVSGYLLSA